MTFSDGYSIRGGVPQGSTKGLSESENAKMSMKYETVILNCNTVNGDIPKGFAYRLWRVSLFLFLSHASCRLTNFLLAER